MHGLQKTASAWKKDLAGKKISNYFSSVFFKYSYLRSVRWIARWPVEKVWRICLPFRIAALCFARDVMDRGSSLHKLHVCWCTVTTQLDLQVFCYHLQKCTLFSPAWKKWAERENRFTSALLARRLLTDERERRSFWALSLPSLSLFLLSRSLRSLRSSSVLLEVPLQSSLCPQWGVLPRGVGFWKFSPFSQVFSSREFPGPWVRPFVSVGERWKEPKNNMAMFAGGAIDRSVSVLLGFRLLPRSRWSVVCGRTDGRQLAKKLATKEIRDKPIGLETYLDRLNETKFTNVWMTSDERLQTSKYKK